MIPTYIDCLVLGLLVGVLVVHVLETRAMLRLLERQIRCLERLAADRDGPDDDEPAREPALVIPFRKGSLSH
jgi:hypothetical protein